VGNDESIQIPFLGGAYEGKSGKINAQQSVNLFSVFDDKEPKVAISMYSTPGLTQRIDIGITGRVRRMHILGDLLYAVTESRVSEIQTNWNAVTLGTLTTSSGHVSMADNGTQLLIVDGTDKGYIVTSGAIALITDADFPSSTSCVFHNGYFIVTETDTGKIYTSKLYDGTNWKALDFATAESAPDDLVGIGTTQRNLWLFGEKSTEIYQSVSNPDFPFDRVPGGIIDLGCAAIASMTEINGVIYWLSDKGFIAKSSGYGYERVSPNNIDYQISTYSDVTDATSYSYEKNGRIFYVIIFPTADKTWGLELLSGQWHEWQSVW